MRCFTVSASQLLVVPQAMHLRNKLLKRYFSAEQAVITQYDEDILRELLCNMKYVRGILNVF